MNNFPSLTFQHALWLISVLSGVHQLLQAAEEILWPQKDPLTERSVITRWRFSEHMICEIPDFPDVSCLVSRDMQIRPPATNCST